jgi:amino acid transporter
MTSDLKRHFGLLHATALNVTLIVGAGIFVTIPSMLKELPGPYALLGWLAAGALILVDGMIWSELGATLPGSGGSYLYLLECYGRERWGRLMAFLFIWQFLLSGPLEIASGLIAISLFSNALSPAFAKFNEAWTWKSPPVGWAGNPLVVTFGPSRALALLIGIVLLVLLYRRITALGKLTVTFWVGVLGVVVWLLVEGWSRFDPAVAFDFSGAAAATPNLATGVGGAMILAMYAYFGYYQICYIGDEVREPGRTIPRAIFLSALLVCALFVGMHLAMLGTVSWKDIPTAKPEVDDYNLAAEFMRRIHDPWAPALVSALLIWSCVGSAFAGLLGYSRIPYGAARYGHFFAPLARVHPVHHIPHVALALVGGLTLFWSFFDLGDVIQALVATRIVEQFIGQAVGVMLLRRREPHRHRPYRIAWYPVPCLVAVLGWLYVYASAPPPFIIFGLATLAVGALAFVLWSRRRSPRVEGDKDCAAGSS